ncbi:TrbI/VirB10 family protein [Polaromonas aquatica]|uniref:TrbI/VirB10 family protein n=1 Tax=Polaromonas aquatica TaxID=332657 RepID=A0ABW1TUC6_9BURK
MSISDKSIIDPEPNNPGIPVKKSTLAVIAALVVGVAFVSALVLNAGNPTTPPIALADAKSTDPTQDSGSKVAIDEELKKAKQAADEEEKKQGGGKPNQTSQPNAQVTHQPGVQPSVTAASVLQNPLPPGVRRDNQDGALYDRALSKGNVTTGTHTAAVAGNGRGGDDFEIEAQVRGAKSVAFDESQGSSGIAQVGQAATVLTGLQAPSGGNGAQRALVALPDAASAGNVQAPSASMQSSMDRMLGNLRAAPGGAAGRSQGGGSGNTAWVSEYAAGTGQRSSETIKSYPTNSPYTLHQGKIIPAVLGRQINSDLPGEITAYVVSNVYDSLGNGALLIPQGSVLAGRYNSEVKPGQERVLFAFNRLIMPNGQSFDLPGAQGSDLAGAAGITGDVNNHFFKMFSASFFTAWLADRVKPQTTTAGTTGLTTSVSPAGQVLVDVSKAILDRNRTIAPTISVEQGTRINVEVKKDMEFSGPYSWSKK